MTAAARARLRIGRVTGLLLAVAALLAPASPAWASGGAAGALGLTMGARAQGVQGVQGVQGAHGAQGNPGTGARAPGRTLQREDGARSGEYGDPAEPGEQESEGDPEADGSGGSYLSDAGEADPCPTDEGHRHGDGAGPGGHGGRSRDHRHSRVHGYGHGPWAEDDELDGAPAASPRELQPPERPSPDGAAGRITAPGLAARPAASTPPRGRSDASRPSASPRDTRTRNADGPTHHPDPGHTWGAALEPVPSARAGGGSRDVAAGTLAEREELLPLGTGLALIGMGAALLGVRLRRF